jgi:SNF2 family DNA or RNA helicase|nr:MAG TPA: Helicase of the snf2 rad54 family [Caudoviricetes sp.]
MNYTPHEYQKYATDRIINTQNIALWLDMGLGKTRITLSAILDLLFNRFMVSKVLIVAPKKVSENTWQAEIEKWDDTRGVLKYSTVLGTQAKRIKALNAPASIYIINRENIPWLVDHYKNSWPFDMVVLDEASSFKNPQAKRFKALKCVRSRISRIVELTGTPSPNGLIDLWAQIFLLDGGQRLGKGIGVFRERWFKPDKRNREQIFTYKPKDGAEVEIKNVLSDICISMKSEDYIQLPEVINVDVTVKLDSAARKAYDTIERTMLLHINETTIEAVTAGALYNKLLQLSNGALYDDCHNYIEVHDCKLAALVETVEALNGEHAIIYYSFQHDLDRIQKALFPLGLRVVKFENKQQENEWNEGKIDILLAHPASVAYGLNLQNGGHHCIWYGVNSSLELTLQANKRLHRQGQKQPVIIHRLLIEDSVEEEAVASLESKDRTEQALLNSVKARIEKVKGKGAVHHK